MFNATSYPQTSSRSAYPINRLQSKTSPTFAGQSEREDLNPDDVDQVKFYVANTSVRMIAMSVTPKTTNPAVMRYLAQEFKRQFRNVDHPALPMPEVTLLQITISKGDPDMVQALLEEGADPMTRDKAGHDAFDWLENKVSAKVSKKDRQAIEKLLVTRLKELARKPEVSDKTPPSSGWSLFSLWGKPSTSKTESPATERTAQSRSQISELSQSAQDSEPSPEEQPRPSTPSEAHTQPETVQPEPERLSMLKARETELTQQLKKMTDNLRSTEAKFTSANQRITEQETKLQEALTKHKNLNEQLVQTNQSKAMLQSKTRQEVDSLTTERKNLQKRLAGLEEKKSSGERLLKRKADELQAESTRLRHEIRERDEQIQALKQDLKTETTEKNKMLETSGATLSSELEKQREGLRQTSQQQLDHLRMALREQHQKALQTERKQLTFLRNQLAKAGQDLKTERGRHQAQRAKQEEQRTREIAELNTRIQNLDQALLQQSEEARKQVESRIQPLQRTIQEIEKKNQALTAQLSNHQTQTTNWESRQKAQLASLLSSNHQLMSQLSDREEESESLKQERDDLWERFNQSHQISQDMVSRFNAQGWHVNSLWQAWMGTGQALQAQSAQMEDQFRQLGEQTERLDEQQEQLRQQDDTLRQTQAQKGVLAKAIASVMEFSTWKRGVSHRKDSINGLVMEDVLKTIEKADSLEEARQKIREAAQFREEQMEALSLRQQFERPARPEPPQKLTRSKSFG